MATVRARFSVLNAIASVEALAESHRDDVAELENIGKAVGTVEKAVEIAGRLPPEVEDKLEVVKSRLQVGLVREAAEPAKEACSKAAAHALSRMLNLERLEAQCVPPEDIELVKAIVDALGPFSGVYTSAISQAKSVRDVVEAAKVFARDWGKVRDSLVAIIKHAKDLRRAASAPALDPVEIVLRVASYEDAEVVTTRLETIAELLGKLASVYKRLSRNMSIVREAVRVCSEAEDREGYACRLAFELERMFNEAFDMVGKLASVQDFGKFLELTSNAREYASRLLRALSAVERAGLMLAAKLPRGTELPYNPILRFREASRLTKLESAQQELLVEVAVAGSLDLAEVLKGGGFSLEDVLQLCSRGIVKCTISV
ncbi:MAG: hypothetical protein ABWW70_03645 [Thermoproteota archaeon]